MRNVVPRALLVLVQAMAMDVALSVLGLSADCAKSDSDSSDKDSSDKRQCSDKSGIQAAMSIIDSGKKLERHSEDFTSAHLLFLGMAVVAGARIFTAVQSVIHLQL